MIMILMKERQKKQLKVTGVFVCKNKLLKTAFKSLQSTKEVNVTTGHLRPDITY